MSNKRKGLPTSIKSRSLGFQRIESDVPGKPSDNYLQTTFLKDCCIDGFPARFGNGIFKKNVIGQLSPRLVRASRVCTMPLWSSRTENEQVNEQYGNDKLEKKPSRFHNFIKKKRFGVSTFDQGLRKTKRMHAAWQPSPFELTTHCGCHSFASVETNKTTKSGGLSVVPCGTTVRVKTKTESNKKENMRQINVHKHCRAEKHVGGISSSVKNDQRS